jgi:hypothetical protein
MTERVGGLLNALHGLTAASEAAALLNGFM